MESIQLPDFSSYNNVDSAYSDFIDKTTTVINEVAPFKQVGVKIDEDVLKRQGKYNDNLKYKRTRNQLQNLIIKK